MPFHPFEVTIPHIAYLCLGGFVVVFGMFSLLLREKLYIGEACWAFLFGVIIGPYGANIFDPRGWGATPAVTNMITLEVTRVVLAIGVFAIGVELPKAYMARHWKSILFLLVPVMTWGWFVSAGLIFALVPGLNFLSSLAVAACLTPTDPILAAAVVGGKYADKHVPAHIRHLLAAESGCNDGAAFPFLYIALYLIMDAPSTGNAIRDWFLLLWLYQVTLGIVIGAAIGIGFRYLMRFCERHNLIDRHSYVAQYISLALLTIGVCTLLGSDDLLAAFSCGTAFAWDGFFNKQTEESVFSSVIDLLFNIAAFVFVGAWMPFSSFQDEELTLSVWRLIVIAILVLLLRRLPIMIALYKWIPDVKTFREAIFSGHFGPIGIGAVFISTLAAEILHNSHSENHQTEMLTNSIQPITAFMVLCSITIHGLSIPSFSLGRRVHSVSTRTWSRHAPPDWTTQARLVERGADDIVINRDRESEMERGDLRPDEKLVEGRRPGTGTATESASVSSGAEKPLEESSSAETKREEDEGADDMREEVPPDGTEIIAEWDEGPHRVIERRAGPGEEVEVEVIRNANIPKDGASSSLFRGTEASVHKHLEPYIKRLRHAPHELERDAEHVAHVIEEETRHAGQAAHDAARHAEADIVPHHPTPSNATAEPAHDDDEEGWASDRSNGASSSVIVRETSADRKRRGNKSSSSKRSAPKLGSTAPGRRGRRRGSMRKGVAGMMGFASGSPSASPSASAERDRPNDREARPAVARGRTPDAPAGSEPGPSSTSSSRPSTARTNSRPGTASGSMRHLRIDSIIAQHAPTSREASPSRSVRFVDDDGRSGVSTPRVQPHPGEDYLDQSTPPDIEDDSARHKVTFELPRPKQ